MTTTPSPSAGSDAGRSAARLRGRPAVGAWRLLVRRAPCVPSSLVPQGQIREAVCGRLTATHGGPPDILVRHELGLCLGATRVDIAAINGMQRGAAGLQSAAAR